MPGANGGNAWAGKQFLLERRRGERVNIKFACLVIDGDRAAFFDSELVRKPVRNDDFEVIRFDLGHSSRALDQPVPARMERNEEHELSADFLYGALERNQVIVVHCSRL